MRLAIAPLLLVLAAPALAQNWTTVPLGTTSDLLGMNSSFQVFVVGRNGFVAEANNDQTVWTTIDVGTTADLYSALQPCGGDVWVGGGHGVVRVLDNGVWVDRSIPDAAEDFHLYTRNCYQASAVGTGGSIYQSTDGGMTWTPQHSGTTYALHAAAGFAVSGPAWAVGDHGTIVNTTDGGNHWTAQNSGTIGNLYGVVENDPVALAVGAGGRILKTTDGGATWAFKPSGTVADLYAISFSGVSAYNLLAVGTAGTVVMTTDYGETWCPLDPGTDRDLYTVDAYTNFEFFVGGKNGLFLESTNAGGGCPPVAGAGAPDVRTARIAVTGPDPNPVTGSARLRLRTQDAATLQVEVVDLLGRRVAALGPETTAPGRDLDLTLDTRGWRDGLYWVRILGSGLDTQRRLMVVR